MDKEDVEDVVYIYIYIYNGILFGLKMNETTPFEAT